MNDEFGTSILVPSGSHAKIVDPEFNPPTKKPQLANNLVNSGGTKASALSALGLGTAAQSNESQAQRLLSGPGDLSDKITAEEFPMLQDTADFLDKWATTPLGPAFEGISEYLRGFGRDMDAKQRAKAAFIAALDVI